MIVQVRRLFETEWRGQFSLNDGELDFSGVSDPELRSELERAFEELPALKADALEIGRFPYINDLWRVILVRRGTPTWLAAACVTTLFQLGFVTNPDFSQFDLRRDSAP
jgi:hypothetical protein